MYIFFTSLLPCLFPSLLPLLQGFCCCCYVFNKNQRRKKEKHPRTFVRRKRRWKDAGGARLVRRRRSAGKTKRDNNEINTKYISHLSLGPVTGENTRVLERGKGLVHLHIRPAAVLFSGSSSSAPSWSDPDPRRSSQPAEAAAGR